MSLSTPSDLTGTESQGSDFYVQRRRRDSENPILLVSLTDSKRWPNLSTVLYGSLPKIFNGMIQSDSDDLCEQFENKKLSCCGETARCFMLCRNIFTRSQCTQAAQLYTRFFIYSFWPSITLNANGQIVKATKSQKLYVNFYLMCHLFVLQRYHCIDT